MSRPSKKHQMILDEKAAAARKAAPPKKVLVIGDNNPLYKGPIGRYMLMVTLLSLMAAKEKEGGEE